MKEINQTKEMLLDSVSKNPGLHFRELQRKTGLAVGQLEYHLYQLEKSGRIVSRRDGKLVRFFSNETGTIRERSLAFHLRNRFSREIITHLIRNDFREITDRDLKNEKINAALKAMLKDGILEEFGKGQQTSVRLRNRDEVLLFLRRYKMSFVESLAFSLLDLLD
ncbi:MAG: winged helix-turn-helix transcriptional regulator [Candidatus Thermoplasmatota archaeon]|nr:winged helix-turn-helix transcriptional regulator [Candidatus Thermoplasmatota archaeon]MCL5793549.1 winged helix-turn-helix transcriptional regulator [Candidatus Thermoplasmatota archaeon]